MRKLGIRPGHRVALVGAPPGFIESLGSAPDGAQLSSEQSIESADVVISCWSGRADLEAQVSPLAAALGDGSALWVCWPRRAAGHTSDLTDNVVRDTLIPEGLVDVKVAAVTKDWSGLRFVRRVELRGSR